MLRGDRAALGQPVRPAEVWVERVNRVIGPLLARRIRPVQAADVRHVPRAPAAPCPLVLSSASMQGASRIV